MISKKTPNELRERERDLQDRGDVSCSIEAHEVERELLELVGPVFILPQLSLQVQTEEMRYHEQLLQNAYKYIFFNLMLIDDKPVKEKLISIFFKLV